MSITDIQWYPYRIPLRTQFVTAHGALTVREGAIVEIRTQEGITGVGEIAPLPGFSGATLNHALGALQQSALVSNLFGKHPLKALAELYAEVGQFPSSAIYGLETALLDALSKMQSRTISTLLVRDGDRIYRNARITVPWLPVMPQKRIPVNAVVGVPTTEAAITNARAAISAGIRCIKLKVGMGFEEDIDRITSVRQAIGPDIVLRLDANEAWTFETARAILQRCADQDIQYVEQPLPASDLEGMRNLRRVVSVPIAVDEAISDLTSARRVLSAEAADILILKPQLAGGLCLSRHIIREAARYGVRCVITSSIETGIGVTAAVHLAAASPEVKLASGLATLHLLTDDLLREELRPHNGHIVVPVRPGLGVQLDRDALKAYSYHLEG